jgi:serine/threonine protein kinase
MSPTTVHNCEIVGQIATGGMAIIYKAVQNSLNRPVAIKELKPEFAGDAQLVARFIRESNLLAKLQHENIVQIYDFIHEGDTFWMVMEYVEGIDLANLIEQVHHIPPDVGALIGLSVCSALEYAHYRGIIHRDIKPANILISHKGEVKLMDFGIARDETLGDFTRPGISMGTPTYMSPEQVLGLKLDSRSDMFSFGIVLYQMLTGFKPFSESGDKSIMHKILLTEFIRPRKLNPNIPRRLETIILRCLAREPAKRYASTGILHQELERYVASKIKLNYSGRLVAYLYHQGSIGREEAENFVAPAVLGDKQLHRTDQNYPPALSLKKMAFVQGILGAILVIWILAAHLTTSQSTLGSETVVAPPPPGMLNVVANPWAEIYIDGAYAETTPLSRSFELTPGVHRVMLKNPYVQSAFRKVLIESTQLKKLKVQLLPKK